MNLDKFHSEGIMASRRNNGFKPWYKFCTRHCSEIPSIDFESTSWSCPWFCPRQNLHGAWSHYSVAKHWNLWFCRAIRQNDRRVTPAMKPRDPECYRASPAPKYNAFLGTPNFRYQKPRVLTNYQVQSLQQYIAFEDPMRARKDNRSKEMAQATSSIRSTSDGRGRGYSQHDFYMETPMIWKPDSIKSTTQNDLW